MDNIKITMNTILFRSYDRNNICVYDHHRELTHLFSVCRDLRIIRNLVYYENSCSMMLHLKFLVI